MANRSNERDARLYKYWSVNHLMIVKSVVTSIIYSVGTCGRFKKKQKKNRPSADPSFIGPEFVHCEVGLGV